MELRRLIINADGLGFTPGVNKGIREVVEFGLVKSTSALANFDATEEISSFVQSFPHVSVGIHLNLSVGRPISEPGRIRTLVNPATGEFWGDKLPYMLMTGRISFTEMVTELDAQVRRLLDLGVEITHVDGHQNKHLYPPFFLATMRVAEKYGIKRIRSHRRFLTGSVGLRFRYYLGHPQRIVTHIAGRVLTDYAHLRGMRMADRLVSPGYADTSRKYLLDSWMKLVRELPKGTSEIYCHPAYPDDLLRQFATYVEPRRDEVDVLTSEDLKRTIQDAGIELISFRDL